MKLLFDDVNLNGQLRRTVAKGDCDVAHVGECLHIASQIEDVSRVSRS